MTAATNTTPPRGCAIFGLAAWLALGACVGARGAEPACGNPAAGLEPAGQRSFDSGRYADAVTKWQAALRLTPKSVDLRNKLGIALTKLKRFAEAEAVFNAAAALAPAEPKTLFNLGMLYLHEGDLDRADKTLRRTLRAASWYPEAHYHIGLIAESKGNVDTAMKEYVKELNVNAGCAKAWLRIKAINQARSGSDTSSADRVSSVSVALAVAGLGIGLVCLLLERRRAQGAAMLLAALLGATAHAADIDYDLYRNAITKAALAQRIQTLSQQPSRVLGYKGCDAAADYVKAEFERIGLTDISVDPFTVPAPIDQGAWLTIAATGKRIRIYPLWPNLVRPPVTPEGGVSGNLIDAANGDFAKLNGKVVDGAVALLDFDTDDRYVDLRVLGVQAIIFPEPDAITRGQAEFKFLNSPVNIPRFWAPKAVVAELRELAKSGRARVKVESRMTWQRAKGYNIYGYLRGVGYKPLAEGEDPKPNDLSQDLIVLEAYYDSMSVVPSLSPGADQACGISTLLELAKLFAQHRPRRSVLFLATSGHGEALAGISEFMLSHSRDEKFKKRVTNPIFRRRFKQQIDFNLLIGLDMSSHTDRLGIFHEAHFTTLGQRPDLATRRFFAPYGQTFTRYAKRIAGQRSLAKLEASLEARGNKLTPEVRAAAETIIAEFSSFATRDVLRWSTTGAENLTAKAVQTAIDQMIAAGLMPPAEKYELNSARFPVADYTLLFGKKKPSLWTRVLTKIGIERPVPDDLPVLPAELKPVVAALAAHKKPFKLEEITGVDEKLLAKTIGLLEKDGSIVKRYEYKAESFLDNGITPVGGVIWQSFIPGGLLALDSEVLVKMALPGVSFVSVNDGRRYFDTPLDTASRVNLDNLTKQARYLACMLAHVLNDDKVFPDIKVKLRDRAKAIRGQVVEFRIGESLLPDYPVGDALVVLRDPSPQVKGQWEKTFMGVRGACMAMTDRDGFFEHPCVLKGTIEIEAYKIDPATGEIMYAADRGPEGDGTYPLKVPMDWRLKETRTVVFKCRSLDIFDLYDPRYLRTLDTINVLGPLDFAPLRYGYSELADRGASVFFEDGERVKVIMGSGVFGIQYLLTNVQPTPATGYVQIKAERAAAKKILIPKGLRITGETGGKYETSEDTYLPKGATTVRVPVRSLVPGSEGNVGAGELDRFESKPPAGIVGVTNKRAIENGDDNPTGVGFKANERGALFRSAHLAAKNMFVLNESRIADLHRYGITNERLERLHGLASTALGLADQAWRQKDYVEYVKHVRAARGFEAKAYPDVRGTANDTVKGIIFYFALLLPFAYFCERLLFGFPDIRKQIAAASTLFVLVFLLLRFVHPAFRLSTSPYIIFLAFVLLAMAVFVITIVVTKFNEQVAEMRRKAAKVHEADVGRLSASAAAFNLGISNMKKRKLRTALTTITLILLTFTVLSFTSVNTYTRFNRIPILRDPEWYRLSAASAARLEAAGAPDAVAAKLAPVKGKIFAKAEELEAAVKPLLSEAELSGHWAAIRQALAKPLYRGLLVRDRNWNFLEDIAFEYVFSGFTHESEAVEIAPRAWYMSNTRDGQLHLRIEAAGGQNTFAVAAIGMTPQEHYTTGIDGPDYMLAGKWLEAGDRRVCVLPSNMADLLGIKPADVGKARVKMFGDEFLVKGIIRSERLSNLVDLDNEQLSPVDLSAEDKQFDPNETVATLRGNAADIRTFSHLDPSGCVYVPYDVVLSMGGTIRSIAVRLADTVDFDAFLDLVKKFMSRVGMTMWVSDSKRVTAYSSMGLSSFSGLGNLLIPIAIAGLIVLNTMMGSVYERFKEIGIYSSVGLAPVHIGALFLAESCVYAVVGAIAGYLIGQVVGTSIAALNLLPGITLNYSSLSAVASTFIVMAVVLLSTLYPAKVASNMAVPDVTRKWQFPEPKGDDWTFDFPFTVASKHVLGLYVFLNNYFDGYKEESVGSFYTNEVEFLTAEHEHGLSYLIRMNAWLAPFDMGISQNVELRALPTEDAGIARIQVFIHRMSGEVSSWKRLNKGFLTEIRKQFLIWRTVPEGIKLDYAEQGSRLIEAMAT